MQILSSVENLPEQRPAAPSVTSAHLLMLAACFGLITGLIEGFGLQTFHGFQWFALNSRIPEGVSIEILWISPIINLVFFLFVGLLLEFLAAWRLVSPSCEWLYFSSPSWQSWIG